MGEPAGPRRLPGGDELPRRIRGPRRPGADHLHGSALRGEVRLELPALRAQARRDPRRRRTHGARAGDGAGVPGHLGAGDPFLPDLPAGSAAARAGAAPPFGEHLRADVRHQPAPRARGDGRGVRAGVLRLADQLPDHLGLPDQDPRDARRLPAVVRARPGAAEGAEAVRGAAGGARRGQRAMGPAPGRRLPRGEGGGETRGSAAPRGRPALQPRQLAGPGRVPRAAAFRVRGQGLRAGRQFALEAQLPGGARTPRRRGPDPRRGQQHPVPALRLGLPLQGAGQPLDRHPDRQLHGREDLRRPDQPQGRRTLPADDHRSGRLGVRPHLRLRDDRLVRGEVGTALDHRRHLPGAPRARPAAAADEHLRVLPAEGAGARPRRRLRVSAPAEPQGRGGRRHRAPRHPGVHRQRRAGAGGGAGGPPGDGRERHAGERPLLRGGDHPGPGGVGGGMVGRFPPPSPTPATSIA